MYTPRDSPRDSSSVCPSSLADQDPSAPFYPSSHTSYVLLNNSFGTLCRTVNKTVLWNKTVLHMLTESSHYLSHGTAEIRDPRISKPLRKHTLPMQGAHGANGGSHILPLLCNISPMNTLRVSCYSLPFNSSSLDSKI